MGFKGGANYIQYQGNVSNLSSKVAYHAGFYVSFRFNNRFGFQPEFVYSQQRASDLLATDSRTTYGYITLPLTAKIFVTRHINVQIIPQIGQLINATMRVPGTPSFNGKTFFKATDLSLGGGIGIESTSGFNVSARYFVGFSDTFKPVLLFRDSKKNTLQVSIGYTLL